MTAKSEIRGNEIKAVDGKWDINKDHHKCGNCGCEPSQEGYDSCLVDYLIGINMIDGVKTYESCCGHGKRMAWIWCSVESTKAIFDIMGYVDPKHSQGERVEVELVGNKKDITVIIIADVNGSMPKEPSAESELAFAKQIAKELYLENKALMRGYRHISSYLERQEWRKDTQSLPTVPKES